MRDLGTLGTGTDALPGSSCANKSSDQVTGFSYIDSTPNPGTGVPTQHAFLWDNGKMTDLGTPGGTLVAFDAAQCVNNRGQVAGVSTLSGDPVSPLTGMPIVHPFLWDHGVLADLGTLGGDFTVTTWLNDAGEVVGGTTTAGEAEFHATLWRDGAITDLGTLEGDCFSLAHAVNSSGQIVGESGSCLTPLRAFLWDEGRIVDLNTLIPANSSLQLVVAANINDRGEIAGTGTPPGCGAENLEKCGHAFLLIPCAVGEDCGSNETLSRRTEPPSNAMTLTQRREVTKSFIARFRARPAQRYRIGNFVPRN